MFHLIKGLVGLYVVLRVIWPMPWPRPMRLVGGILVLVISQHHLLSHLVFGTMFSPEVPLGILTALVGAPFFLWLLAAGKRGWA